jgi:hypothetical protein
MNSRNSYKLPIIPFTVIAMKTTVIIAVDWGAAKVSAFKTRAAAERALRALGLILLENGSWVRDEQAFDQGEYWTFTEATLE